jgi:hypothetical protein
MSTNEGQGLFKPYVPENPISEDAKQREIQKIREAAKRAAQVAAAEDSGDTAPITPEKKQQSDKELHDAVKKVKTRAKKG